MTTSFLLLKQPRFFAFFQQNVHTCNLVGWRFYFFVCLIVYPVSIIRIYTITDISNYVLTLNIIDSCIVENQFNKLLPVFFQ